MLETNRTIVNQSLKPYKLPTGQVNFRELFCIPTRERLPMMVENDFQETFILVCAAITMASESMNLKRGLNASQIEEITEAVLETCSEDNLALEDFVLFLQRLVRGEYGTNYESMDVPKFMEKFEMYREQRFKALQELRYEEHINRSSNCYEPRLSEQLSNKEKIKNIGAIIEYNKMKSGNEKKGKI